MPDAFIKNGLGPDSFYRTYCGSPPPPENLWQHWNFDPFVIALLSLLILASFRSQRPATGLAAAAVLFVAFVSPLCALSSALFSARVVHHILLFTIAAPLLAVFKPPRHMVSAGLAFVVSSLTLWMWHAPPLYDAALAHVGVYWLMQASLLFSAVWFWSAVLDARRSTVEGLYLIVAGLAQMGLLGALLTFAQEPLYAAHAHAPLDWGLSPLADQQLAGLIMWVPAALPYMLIGAWRARDAWVKQAGRLA